MDEKTNKKRVTAQKQAVQKKAEVSESVSAEPAVPVPVSIEAKKVKRSTKTESKSTAKKPAATGPRSDQMQPTFEQIQLRAYFISEHRRERGIAGNEHQDWLTAEQELSWL
jgi:hypothetical protein